MGLEGVHDRLAIDKIPQEFREAGAFLHQVKQVKFPAQLPVIALLGLPYLRGLGWGCLR